MVELTHDSRPIIGRGPPLTAYFLTLAAISVGLMVADQRYHQIDRIRESLSTVIYPVQRAVDFPFRATDWVTGSFADRSRLRQENLELTARLRLRQPAAAAFRGAGGRKPAPARHAREHGRHRRQSAGVLDPERRPRSVPPPRAARQGRGRWRVQGPGRAGRRRHLRPGLEGQRVHGRSHPDQRRRTRDPGAVQPQRRAHDCRRHRRPEQAVAAFRHRRIRPGAGRPAALHRTGRRVPARLPGGAGFQGQACRQHVRAGRSQAHGQARPGTRSAAGLVQGAGRTGAGDDARPRRCSFAAQADFACSSVTTRQLARSNCAAAGEPAATPPPATPAPQAQAGDE